MITPEIALKWEMAKKGAVELAPKIGAEVKQGPEGEKIVLHNGQRKEFKTWFAAYCYVSGVYTDQIRPKVPAAIVTNDLHIPQTRSVQASKTIIRGKNKTVIDLT